MSRRAGSQRYRTRGCRSGEALQLLARVERVDLGEGFAADRRQLWRLGDEVFVDDHHIDVGLREVGGIVLDQREIGGCGAGALSAAEAAAAPQMSIMALMRRSR